MGFVLFDFTSYGLGLSHSLKHCASGRMYARESISCLFISLFLRSAMQCFIAHLFNYLSQWLVGFLLQEF